MMDHDAIKKSGDYLSDHLSSISAHLEQVDDLIQGYERHWPERGDMYRDWYRIAYEALWVIWANLNDGEDDEVMDRFPELKEEGKS